MSGGPSKRKHGTTISNQDLNKKVRYSVESGDTDTCSAKNTSGSAILTERFTIGWICAIPEELAAASFMLDEDFGLLKNKPFADENNYRLGRIGEHNIAIACLPQYGVEKAAATAKDMLRTFSSIKFGLMVGVGGGIPSNDDDIRLGDVVVCDPDHTFGGVVQWDTGKAKRRGEFERTGSLNKPPTLLLTALRTLRARHLECGDQIAETIQGILNKKPYIRKRNFHPQEPSGDILYHVECQEHIEYDDNCKACRTAATPFERPVRQIQEPMIHYGTIASGNQVIKDGHQREELRKLFSAKCVEMEAAGLMDSFPCLVIRGICDYADSRKNKHWQPYAAMTAAAFAKEFLGVVPPQEVEIAPNAIDAVEGVKADLAEVGRTINLIQTGLETTLDSTRRSQMEDWLRPADPSTNLNKAIKLRHHLSGIWFLESTQFAKWAAASGSFLWLHGLPGCGKTVLSSTVVGSLAKDESLYFYFDFSDNKKQTFDNMIRSLLYQLYCKQGKFQPPLDALFQSKNHGQEQPSSDELQGALLRMVALGSYVSVVIDALDECETRGELLSWISHIAKDRTRAVRLIVTSRQESDIESALSEWANPEEIVPIQNSQVNSDIEIYLRDRLREDDGFKRWNRHTDVLTKIEVAITEKADGMFRWAACQLDTLVDCFDLSMLEEALACLPSTLHGTYDRILNKVPHTWRKSVVRVLQFLAYSDKPLRLEDAVDALAVDLQRHPPFHPKYRMPQPRDILRLCSSLVMCVNERDWSSSFRWERERTVFMLQLAHFSVKEYLLSEKVQNDFAPYFKETEARAAIMMVCVAYLSQLDIDTTSFPSPNAWMESPFAQYSATQWPAHARVMETDHEAARSIILGIFLKGGTVYNWLRLVGQNGRISPQKFPKHNLNDSLYYAARAGLRSAVEVLLQEGVSVNARGRGCENALIAASGSGWEEIVRTLLGKGAEVNKREWRSGTALNAALINGHSKVVQLLLDSGADVNARGGGYGDALQVALWGHGGDKEIIPMLFGRGAGVSPLQIASHSGLDNIVQILLGWGADVDARGGEYDNALQAASLMGHDKIVQMLLSRGADVNAQGGEYGNALQAAAYMGRDTNVRMLLSGGADVNAQGGMYGNALQAAACMGRNKIFQMLLNRGADVNAQGGMYGNALEAGSLKGHDKIIQLLLDRGARR